MDNRGNLLGITGTTPNIGTTVAAFQLAWSLAKTHREVGYVCLNLKSSKIHRYLGMNKTTHGLRTLRPQLRSGYLSPVMLEEHMTRIQVSGTNGHGLHVLTGNTEREQAEYYEPADIHHLLDALRAAFTWTVVDVNAYWDNAATLETMISADQLVLVTTLDAGQFMEDRLAWWGKWSKLLPMTAAQPKVIVTRVPRTASYESFTPKDVVKHTGWPLRQVIYEDPRLTERLNRGQLLQAMSAPAQPSLLQNLLRPARKIWSKDAARP